jgi:hypothetical protein
VLRVDEARARLALSEVWQPRGVWEMFVRAYREDFRLPIQDEAPLHALRDHARARPMYASSDLNRNWDRCVHSAITTLSPAAP